MSQTARATKLWNVRFRSGAGGLLPLLVAACVVAPDAHPRAADVASASEEQVSEDGDVNVAPARCGEIAIVTREQYEAARNCEVIDGDLRISWLSEVFDLEFPKLIEVSGEISPLYLGFPHPLQRLHMPALKNVGGSVILSATVLETIEWPELRSIGGQFALISIETLTRLSAPKLETIGGPFQVTIDTQLEQIDLRSLRRIEGGVALSLLYALEDLQLDQIESVQGSAELLGLVRLPADSVMPLWLASDQTRALAAIGCCIAGEHVDAGCEAFDPAACATLR